MRWNKSREDLDEEARAEINTLRGIAQLTPAIKSVITRFNGKIYNRRIDTAIQAEIDKVAGMMAYADGSEFSKYRSRSEKYKEYAILRITPGRNWNRQINVTYIYFGEDGRIQADKSIWSLIEHRTTILKEAAELERDMGLVDDFIRNIEAIRKMLSGMNDSIGWKAKSIYGLHFTFDGRYY